MINTINATQETQAADPEQNQLVDRDHSDIDHDPIIVDRDPDTIDHESRPRERANDVIGFKDESMSTKEHEEGKHGNLTYHHESGVLYAEGEDQHMAVLSEVVSSTAGNTIDDIQVVDPRTSLSEI